MIQYLLLLAALLTPVWSTTYFPSTIPSSQSLSQDATTSSAVALTTDTSSSNVVHTTHFSPTWPAGQIIASSTAAAALSTLSVLDASWKMTPQYTAIESAIFMAAPTSAQLSIAISGYNFDAIVAEQWYIDHVDPGWQKNVNEQEDVLQQGFDAAVGNAGIRVRVSGILAATMAIAMVMGLVLAL